MSGINKWKISSCQDVLLLIYMQKGMLIAHFTKLSQLLHLDFRWYDCLWSHDHTWQYVYSNLQCELKQRTYWVQAEEQSTIKRQYFAPRQKVCAYAFRQSFLTRKLKCLLIFLGTAGSHGTLWAPWPLEGQRFWGLYVFACDIHRTRKCEFICVCVCVKSF